ncbi:MAG: hypothetical protein J6K96_06800 [Treponema sp.]|nr:hypothetical protein [Treponema sp.]
MKAEEILPILIHQLKNNFMLSEKETELLMAIRENVYRGGYNKTIECFRKANYKYFSEENGLNPYNSVMYCNYLYQTSHILYKEGYTEIADKVYYLNKMLNGVDLFYAIDLPEHWSCEHPLGSVMGRAQYGDYFFFYQGCTVGGNHMNYPVIGNDVTMYSNSKILGKSHIGNNVIIGANAYVKDTDIPNDTIVFGEFPNLIFKQNKNIDKIWK